MEETSEEFKECIVRRMGALDDPRRVVEESSQSISGGGILSRIVYSSRRNYACHLKCPINVPFIAIIRQNVVESPLRECNPSGKIRNRFPSICPTRST